MRAVVCHGKKDLRLDTRDDRPLAPDEVRVGVAFGGICGSDLHYFHRGAVGDFAIREPMALGHEISGVVLEVGQTVVLSGAQRPASAIGSNARPSKAPNASQRSSAPSISSSSTTLLRCVSV